MAVLEEEDFEKILKEKGIDVILDMVGGDYIAKNIRLLREEGHLVFINMMDGSKVDGVDFARIMRNRLTITGSTLRNRDVAFKAHLTQEIQALVWPQIAQNKFKPVIYKVFPMAQAAQAHALMEAGTHIGKIMLTNAIEL